MLLSYTFYWVIFYLFIRVSPKFYKFNSAALDAFDKVMKMMNYTGLWNVKLVWYFQGVTCWIYLCSLEPGLRIHGFWPAWPCLIIKVLTTEWNFLNHLMIDSTFTFLYNKCFWLHLCIMTRFELLKHKFPN